MSDDWMMDEAVSLQISAVRTGKCSLMLLSCLWPLRDVFGTSASAPSLLSSLLCLLMADSRRLIAVRYCLSSISSFPNASTVAAKAVSLSSEPDA